MKFRSVLVSGVFLLSIVLATSGCHSSKSSAPNPPPVANPPPAYNPPPYGNPQFPAPKPAVSSQPIQNSQAADPTPPSGYILVKSADGNVSIFVPPGWNTNATQLYPGSVIGIADDKNSEYLIVTEKAKSSMKANSTVNDYLDMAKSAFGTAVNNPVWGQPSDVTIGGCKGLAVRLTGARKSNNTDTVYFINILESKNYFYDVCGYTLTASESANKPTIENIIDSFKEKD